LNGQTYKDAPTVKKFARKAQFLKELQKRMLGLKFLIN